MLGKIKMAWNSKMTYRIILEANNEHVVEPFFHGIQMEHRMFANYIFVKNSQENQNALQLRSFEDFNEAIGKHVNWELGDEIVDLADKLLYNKKHNLLINMIPDSIWDKLNTAINIAERIDTNPETRREIIINAYNELNGINKPKEKVKRNRYNTEETV